LFQAIIGDDQSLLHLFDVVSQCFIGMQGLCLKAEFAGVQVILGVMSVIVTTGVFCPTVLGIRVPLLD